MRKYSRIDESKAVAMYQQGSNAREIAARLGCSQSGAYRFISRILKYNPDMHIIGKIVKADVERRQIFGWAWTSEVDGELVVDSHGDTIEPATLEKAVYNFVIESRVGKEMHSGGSKSRMIESIVFTKEKQEALGIDLKKVAWWVGFQVDDAEVWQKIKDGEYNDFSIGGTAVRA